MCAYGIFELYLYIYFIAYWQVDFLSFLIVEKNLQAEIC